LFDTNKIKYTKNIIDSIHTNFGLDYLIQFGRVAVPYSGETAVDGHSNHVGAWPADCYYGIFTNKWTDSIADAYSAIDPRNYNVPFDGKFDQSIIEDTVRVRIGRIDFYNLPVFPESEIQLYKRYINKIINYNNTVSRPNFKALVDDRLGVWFEDIFASEAITNFNAIFEHDSIIYDSLQNRISKESFLMSSVYTLGLYDSLEWVFNSKYFTQKESKSVLMSFLGSYMGDWDSQNNIIRSSIASSPFTLAAYFAARPYWHLHRLGLGETIGSAYKLTINNDMNQYRSNSIFGIKGMHIALMGDPTVRFYRLPPPTNLTFNRNNGILNFRWDYSDDDIIRFEVYKSNKDRTDFELIAIVPYSDRFLMYYESNEDINSIYIIKAVKMQQSLNGTFVNRSIGAFANYTMNVSSDNNSDNPASINIQDNLLEIQAINNIDNIEIYDILGNTVYSNYSQSNSYIIELNKLCKGFLLIRVKIEKKYFSKSFVN
jgi:hypothetical protein